MQRPSESEQAMLTMRKTEQEMPDDPLAPVMTRMITTTRPVTSAWWMPGMWAGTGCDLAGVEPGSTANDDALEAMVADSGGAFDIVLTELPAIVKATAIRSGKRDEAWFATIMRYATDMLPIALAEVWEHNDIGLPMEHVKYIAGLYTHPVSCCWPVAADLYHVHAIVVGKVGCSDPGCTAPH